MKPQTLGMLLQSYFLQRLIRDRNVSPATVSAYRDTFRLFLRFAEGRVRRSSTTFTLSDFTAPLVLAFLTHLEQVRGNSIRTRNARLAALRAFAHYAASEDPTALPTIQRVLAIPMKHHSRPVLGYLTKEEVQAILDAPDASTAAGRRDRILFLLLYNTGARVSEAVGLVVKDLHLDRAPHVTLHGKGRKERTVPLWPTTARALRRWLAIRHADPDAALFMGRDAARLGRSGVARRLARALRSAAVHCPSLRGRRVSPHTFRHTTAMHLLESGTDLTIIALWLGHESTSTTHGYLEASLPAKQRALDGVLPPRQRRRRFVPTASLLAFLDGL